MSNKIFRQIPVNWMVALLLLLYTCLQSYCIQQLSLNYDEGSFLSYGASLLKLQRNKDVARFDSKLPITALNALPRAAQQVFYPSLKKHDSVDDVLMGRYVSLLATLLLALLVFRWGSLLYGKVAGLCSLIVLLLCPNFLAHGIFVSSDIFACLFMTAAFFYLWRFSGNFVMKNWLLVCASVALAEISKFSMVHLLLIVPLLLFLFFIHKRQVSAHSFTRGKFIYLLLIFGFVNWFVISAAHLFYGMFIPLGNYEFRSGAFLEVQHFLPHVPVPFPSSYIQSMDAVIYFDHLGGGEPGSLNGATYLLGENRVHGFWYYYFVVLFFKLPVATLVILLITILYYLRGDAWKNFLSREICLLLPALYFLVYLNFFYSTQLGVRHVMIILPLLYVFTGFFFQHIKMRTMKYTACILLVYQCVSVSLYFPHFLPYTNEFITDKKNAYQKIADTNLCYGEGEKYLHQYLQQHPDVKYMPPAVTAGKVIMEVNEMLNLNIATVGKFDWARLLKPESHIHSQYIIFNISASAADSLKQFKKHEGN